ncbi:MULTISPECIES: carbohydrate ABC transporter permease [Corynebacterium]|uniref:Sugar ABC transporter permease n=2 Tax=Corynebacterium glucuronolyticum TaxID=39791 RepID=A0A7T4EH33_9CORY|nr:MULTISPECIES: sugar ABC transporter permease [Corynebacterium]EEI25929.1 ABC transporter, permease protein [Corynebacterium glucuronolyticum ATCC 51867]EEI64265.1 ABC transporter, permease protein [Corynebacterium glucuronolyticum ATCC 51866]MCT1442291.1 sugar ABC transporter permease [Corynebacterium glucuronolyticum]OFO46093.1 ABC transporter permease [Corynebacterium sp. HMSC073D01]QQB47263.1 sugar ABC transporter permease [Corynebacterium glucuronolyticum]
MQTSLKKYFPIFVLPTLLAFLIAFLVPFVIGFFLSFADFTTITDATFVGIDNYKQAFTAREGFIDSFVFTVLVVIVSIITVNIAAFAIAWTLTRKLKGTNFFRTVFFMPNLIGGIVLGYTWQSMINAVLAKYGTTIVADWKYGYLGLIMLINWQLVGYMMIIYIAGLQNVPPELIEAAEIDGAGRGEILRHVTIPMVMPSITICLFLTLSNTFKLFDQNLALTNGAPRSQTEMVALNIVNTMFNRVGSEGVGQAKAVIFVVVVVVIAMFQLRATRSREVEA